MKTRWLKIAASLLSLLGFATACGVSSKSTAKIDPSAAAEDGVVVDTVKFEPTIRVMYGVMPARRVEVVAPEEDKK